MPVVQRGKKWQVSIGSGKDRVRFTVDSKEEGLILEQQELMKRKRAALGIAEPQETTPAKPVVSVTMNRLYDMACRTKWREASDAQMKNAGLIVRMLGERTPVHEVNRERVHELIEEMYELGNTGATINRKLSALSVMLSIAEEEGWIERAPKLPRQQEAKHRIRFFNVAEENEMLSVCEKLGMNALADFIQFAIDTGFRRMEALNLTIRDCENGNAVLHAGETKSRSGRSH
jgi:integrase